jgi:hypothetical protein
LSSQKPPPLLAHLVLLSSASLLEFFDSLSFRPLLSSELHTSMYQFHLYRVESLYSVIAPTGFCSTEPPSEDSSSIFIFVPNKILSLPAEPCAAQLASVELHASCSSFTKFTDYVLVPPGLFPSSTIPSAWTLTLVPPDAPPTLPRSAGSRPLVGILST